MIFLVFAPDPPPPSPLPPVDHDDILYPEFERAFYRTPPDLASLTDAEIASRRARTPQSTFSLSPPHLTPSLPRLSNPLPNPRRVRQARGPGHPRRRPGRPPGPHLPLRAVRLRRPPPPPPQAARLRGAHGGAGAGAAGCAVGQRRAVRGENRQREDAGLPPPPRPSRPGARFSSCTLSPAFRLLFACFRMPAPRTERHRSTGVSRMRFERGRTPPVRTTPRSNFEQDQEELARGEGPIGLVLAPARELAQQVRPSSPSPPPAAAAAAPALLAPRHASSFSPAFFFGGCANNPCVVPPGSHRGCPYRAAVAPQIHIEARKIAKIYSLRVAGAYGGADKTQQFKDFKAGAEARRAARSLALPMNHAPAFFSFPPLSLHGRLLAGSARRLPAP